MQSEMSVSDILALFNILFNLPLSKDITICNKLNQIRFIIASMQKGFLLENLALSFLKENLNS